MGPSRRTGPCAVDGLLRDRYVSSVIIVALVTVVAVLAALTWWGAARRIHRSVTRVDTGLHLLEVELDKRRALVPELVRAAVDADLSRSAVNHLVGARSWSEAVNAERFALAHRAAAENGLSVALHDVTFEAREVYHHTPLGWDFIRPAMELDRIEHRIAGAVKVYNAQAAQLARVVRSPLGRPFARVLGVNEPELFVETASTESALPALDLAA